MTAFDYAVLLIMGLSLVLSIMRGAVREVLALLAWVVAFWVANLYSAYFAPMLPASIPEESLRFLAAFVGLFLVTLLGMSLLTIALSELVKMAGLGLMDRVLGALFGLVRGLVIVLILVLLGGLTNLPRQHFWQTAMFSAPLEALVLSLRPWLPLDVARRIKYE